MHLKTILFLALSLSLSLNAFAHNNGDVTTWHTTNLPDSETQAINQASESQLSSITECMSDQDTTDINETSCINEVFGDVHN